MIKQQRYDKHRRIFEAIADIRLNKEKGYRFESKTINGKEVGRIINKSFNVNFYIDDICLYNLKCKWKTSGLQNYVSFKDWILQRELE